MVDEERVATFKLFDGLSRKELESILAIAQEITYSPDEVILQESSLGSNVYVLLEGRVGVDLSSPDLHRDGREKKELAILRKGDVFGEIAFLAGKRRSAGVSAIDEVQVLRMEDSKLRDLFDRNNHIGYLVMRNLAAIVAQRLVDVNFRWRDTN